MAEAPEGIVFSSSNSPIDYTDLLGDNANSNQVKVLSKSLIESLDLISEGPIGGLITGKYTYSGTLGNVGWDSVSLTGFKAPDGVTGVEYLRSIYFNEIPVLNDDGRFNFQSVNVAKTVGLPNGSVLQTLTPYQTISRTIGERLLGPEQVYSTPYPKFYRILNPNCNAAYLNVKIPTLIYSNPTSQNTERTTVEYEVSYRPLYTDKTVENFTLVKKEIIFGKTTSSYVRSTRINLTNGKR
jgi:predicted phage tail protein